jgi:hypothetical protein
MSLLGRCFGRDIGQEEENVASEVVEELVNDMWVGRGVGLGGCEE